MAVSTRTSVPQDILVFSHLRWDFVYQRPQHLLSRFARVHRVFFWEEPRFEDISAATVDVSRREGRLTVIVPILPVGVTKQQSWDLQRQLLHRFMEHEEILHFITWYYTPLAHRFTTELEPRVAVYDCMDELSAFRGAPPGLTSAEADLFRSADLVFTGGRSLYASKRSQHSSVHLFPSSIDSGHFSKARFPHSEPADQQPIPHPRIGYCGVIDERMDLGLLAEVAALRNDWHLVMIGPVVKISETELPRRENIHYLGGKQYLKLPTYFSGWDVGMLPFALNDSTRFISPTKTPEYLAAGLPVVSTPIQDVVDPYGELGLVSIAASAQEFVAAVEQLLGRDRLQEAARLKLVDRFLARSSWDSTFDQMRKLITMEARRKRTRSTDLKTREGAMAD